MNKSGGHVKCKKSCQPKNNQNYGDRRKHVGYLLASEISYLEDEGLCHCEHFRIFIYIQLKTEEIPVRLLLILVNPRGTMVSTLSVSHDLFRGIGFRVRNRGLLIDRLLNRLRALV